MKVLIHIQKYKKHNIGFPQDIKQFMFNTVGLSITKTDEDDDWIYLELEDNEGGLKI